METSSKFSSCSFMAMALSDFCRESKDLKELQNSINQRIMLVDRYSKELRNNAYDRETLNRKEALRRKGQNVHTSILVDLEKYNQFAEGLQTKLQNVQAAMKSEIESLMQKPFYPGEHFGTTLRSPILKPQMTVNHELITQVGHSKTPNSSVDDAVITKQNGPSVELLQGLPASMGNSGHIFVEEFDDDGDFDWSAIDAQIDYNGSNAGHGNNYVLNENRRVISQEFSNMAQNVHTPTSSGLNHVISVTTVPDGGTSPHGNMDGHPDDGFDDDDGFDWGAVCSQMDHNCNIVGTTNTSNDNNVGTKLRFTPISSILRPRQRKVNRIIKKKET